MRDLPGRELVVRVIAGDRDARDEFARRYQPLIRGVVGRMRLPLTVASSAAQEVWTKMLQNDCRVLRQWRGDDSIGFFLARVVRNCALDTLRLYGRRPDTVGLGGEDASPLRALIAPRHREPLALVAKNEELARVHQMVSALSPADQDLFWRRFIFEQAPHEIARYYRIEANALHARLHRLRERVARILEVEAPDLHARLPE